MVNLETTNHLNRANSLTIRSIGSTDQSGSTSSSALC
jgi:hypothetical protein